MRKGILLWFLAILFILTGVCRAGQYWLSESEAYWWYWDDNPDYQVMIPSRVEGRTYNSINIFGVRSLDLTLRPNGPVIRISTINQVQGGYAAVRDGVIKRWQPAAAFKVTSDSVITTRQGIRANFFVATGKTGTGESAMIRGVVYTKGNSVVVLELLCNEKDYADETKTQWIEVVNTFNWR
ncbi:MAG TPA: hypothetical protein GXZ82_15205 [Firmicutes bacterium]|jgi:hypothetical protein|nr:hypothetical protein [Bacillota bacterium]